MLIMSNAWTFAIVGVESTSSLRIKLDTVFRKVSNMPRGVSLNVAAIKHIL